MPFAKIGGKKLKSINLERSLQEKQQIQRTFSTTLKIMAHLYQSQTIYRKTEAVNIVQEVIKPDFAEAGVNTENDEIMQIVEGSAVDKSTGAKDWRNVKKIIDGLLPTLRGRVVVITNLSGSVYLKSQEDKNGRNLDLVKEANGKEYFRAKNLLR